MKPLTALGETPAALPGTPLSGSTTNSQIFLKAKFLLCAGFGIFMFLCPLGGDGFNTPLSLLTDAIDKFISTNLPSEFTRFVIGGLSLVQIIYLTEVGSIIVKADVGIDMKRLFIIFLERTVLALPLLVLAAHFILE